MQDLYRELDTDGDGEINFEEFDAGLKKCGFLVNRRDTEAIYQMIDRDHSRTIDYYTKQFYCYMQQLNPNNLQQVGLVIVEKLWMAIVILITVENPVPIRKPIEIHGGVLILVLHVQLVQLKYKIVNVLVIVVNVFKNLKFK